MDRAKGWTSRTDRRGARLLTALRKGGLTVADLREFLRAVDEVGVSDAAQVRYEASSLSESGARTYELSASEDYEPAEAG